MVVCGVIGVLVVDAQVCLSFLALSWKQHGGWQDFMHGLLMFQGMSLSQDQPSDVQLCVLGSGVGLCDRARFCEVLESGHVLILYN